MQEVITGVVLFFTLGFVFGWGVYSVFYAFKCATDFGKEITRND